jgi:adenylylsulfate kinase
VPNVDGFGIWLTGLPASGKTTLAHGLEQALQSRGFQAQILDSDELRHRLTPNPTYTQKERDWFYQTMASIGGLLAHHSINVIFAATANRRSHREAGRKRIPRFAEIYVRCSLKTCMARDKKGVYEKGLSGQASTVPGLQVPYEPPESPAAVVDTEEQTVEEGVRRIMDRLGVLSFLRNETIEDRLDDDY